MHKKTSSLVPGADTAVLFIHGIVGSPAHFRQVIDLEGRVPKDWSFVNLCLPGHGGSVLDFGRSSMKAWKACVEEAFDMLAAIHENVIIVGHSMGTLFAIRLACKHPEKVPQLLLLQCPLVVGLRLSGVVNALRLPFGSVKPDNVVGNAMGSSCGVLIERNLLKYVTWVPRFLELFGEMYSVQKLLPHLTVPTVAFQSRKDEMVSNLSAKILRISGRVEVREFRESTHFYYPESFQKEVFAEFDNICRKIEALCQ